MRNESPTALNSSIENLRKEIDNKILEFNKKNTVNDPINHPRIVNNSLQTTYSPNATQKQPENVVFFGHDYDDTGIQTILGNLNLIKPNINNVFNILVVRKMARTDPSDKVYTDKGNLTLFIYDTQLDNKCKETWIKATNNNIIFTEVEADFDKLYITPENIRKLENELNQRINSFNLSRKYSY